MSRTSSQETKYNWLKERQKTKAGHIYESLHQAKDRAKNKVLAFDLTQEYLESIAVDRCPIFGTEFKWGRYNGFAKDETPSLDRIIPELGYVQGNVAFISKLANMIKSTATEKELYMVADWLHDKRKEVQNAFKDRPAPVPIEYTGRSERKIKLRAIHGAGPREDCDGSHHNRGESEGKDASCGTKESCRICVEARGNEMESLVATYRNNSFGEPFETLEQFARKLGCVCYQRGKSRVASGQLAFEGF